MKSQQREPGQIIVLFALMLVAMVGMAGLVLDGSSTYAQRRDEQNAADLAAIAGAVAKLNGGSPSSAVTQSLAVAKANGFDDADADVVVTVDASVAGRVKVDVLAPHQNYFAGIFGATKWDVAVTATAEYGVPTGGVGSAPIIFSMQAFGPNGLPYAEYGCAAPPCTTSGFGDGNGDIPNNAGDVAWTLFGPNVNTSSVRPYLSGTSLLSQSFSYNDYIGQSNGGFHNTLFGSGTGVADSSECTGASGHTDVDACLSGKDVVVPIVSPLGTTCNNGHDGGCFRGWALFHVVRATGGSTKSIEGYFVSGVSRFGTGYTLCTNADLTTCPGFHGLYSVKLVN